MSYTWNSEPPPDMPLIKPSGWARVALRGMAIVCLLGVGVFVSGLTRLVERQLYTTRRPWTAPITRITLGMVLRVIGLRLKTKGRPMRQPGAVVANHVSWLDILALHACQTVVFVSKSEVSGWPGIGFLARFVGTVFINRAPREARVQRDILADAMRNGARLMLFPEGTSTDGMRVLPFKSTLFEMMLMSDTSADLHVQPISVIYDPPQGKEDTRIYAWWGEMELGPHLAMILSLARQGCVTVIFHEPLKTADFVNRKALAQAAEMAVRAGMPEERRARY